MTGRPLPRLRMEGVVTAVEEGGRVVVEARAGGLRRRVVAYVSPKLGPVDLGDSVVVIVQRFKPDVGSISRRRASS